MDKRFVVNRQGKDFVLYAGLVDQAHKEGLKRISTKLVQPPTDDNGHLAICWAEVETEKGVFSGIGDASPENVGRMIAPHITRMAETRAKARALRDAVNVGMTAVEELADDGEAGAEGERQEQRKGGQRQQTAPQPQQAAPSDQSQQAPQTGNRATPQQIDRLKKLQQACGRPASVPQDLTSEVAAGMIRELVGIFNAQSRGVRTPQPPADPHPQREATDLHWSLTLELANQWHQASGEEGPDLDEWRDAAEFEALITLRIGQLAKKQAQTPPISAAQQRDLATAREMYGQHGVQLNVPAMSGPATAWALDTLRTVLRSTLDARKAEQAAAPAAK